MTTDQKKHKNGAPVWQEKDKTSSQVHRRWGFRKFSSVKELLERLQKEN